MSLPIAAVITANSNTGLATIKHLIANHTDKVRVRAVVRGLNKVEEAPELKDLPVEIITGDVAKHQALKPVFAGVRSAFFTVPANEERVKLGKQFVDHCFEFGIEYAVILSIVGSEEQATDTQREFWEIESYAKSKANQPVKVAIGDKGKRLFQPIVLRAAPLYQNFYSSLGALQTGHVYIPLDIDHRLAHVHLEDLARCAAAVLAEPEKHGNKTYNIIGEYQAGPAIAAAMTSGSGLGVQFSPVSDAVAIEALTVLGIKLSVARAAVDMIAWFRAGSGQGLVSDVEGITGRAPVKFRDFVREEIKPILT